jgi:hypothetical protein
MAVVVVLILAGHRGGVPLIDQDAVEEFAANGADETFGDRVAVAPARASCGYRWR